ncbi:hypothetical protein ABL78_1606 [Leptomonas seymouri]|uniref:Uncharacterized protein n=1 Tax=Leptomonas seymouri TaxID=5684 RepID=A0A0N1I8N1_LEPSE|nr:hypothetical protein ABL78_1606 [Leptomonas seymouri]|eukprot:KPI89273.1 hypothetical protein ABL78_1606 [Leptomonas seymouri]
MSDRGCGAAVHAGVKRQRQRDLADERREKRVEDVLAHTTHIVDAIAGINSNYICSLNDECTRLACRVEELQTQHTSHQLERSETTTQLVYHNLKSLRNAVSTNVKDRFIELLRGQVDQGQSEVIDTLTAHIDDALKGSLSVVDTQLSAERQLSATLVEQLRTYTQMLLATAKAANQRAFKAEVDSMHKDVVMAKLRATQLFEQNRLLRHEHEVDALMRVVAQLAEKSRFVESARTELLKAKRHVRCLEKYLDLNGIVAAVQTESVAAASSSGGAAEAIPPLPPNPVLRESAPHYFALKMLEHKEITLTELVDSWQGQESRILEAERRYAQLENVVRQVQHDALVVHQRYLEEKQRREIADRQITDMVRERLYPQKDASAFQEMQRLRWAYTEVVDDAAQLAVSLKVCRDELQEVQAEVSRLTSQVGQLKRDAETDQVALTIQELRSEYTGRVLGLEEVFVRTQLQLSLAQQISRQYGSVAAEATDALQQASRANAEFSEVPPPVAPREDSWRNSGWYEDVQKAEAQAAKLLSLTSEIKSFGLQHGELYEAQMEKLMEQWSRMRSETAQKPTGTRAADGSSSSGPHNASSTLGSSTAPSAEFATKMDSVVNSSKMALREALLLLVASLQSTDVERSNLLDASLSDAQYVTELVKEIAAITNERDRLRAQVKLCRDLLEKNHVTVVERALMHDVPVEDSLNVAEAAERITVLRDQLAAAKQLCDRALGEVKQVTSEKETAEANLMELTRVHEVLQAHAARLADNLRASMEKETALIEERASLQHQIALLVQQPATAAASTGDGDAVAATAACPPSMQLSALFATLSETVQRLDKEIRSLHSSRDNRGGDAPDSSTASIAADEKRDEEGGDTVLQESLSRSGMMSVVGALKDTLHKAGLLKASLASATGAQAAALCAAASAAAEPGEGGTWVDSPVIPKPALETQQHGRAYVAAQYESKLAQYAAERQQMLERLQRAEQTAGEMEAANRRLLGVSKSVLEKQNVLKAENEALRAQLTQLTAPPAPPAVEEVAEEDTVAPSLARPLLDTAQASLSRGTVAASLTTDSPAEGGEQATAVTASAETQEEQAPTEGVARTPERVCTTVPLAEVAEAAAAETPVEKVGTEVGEEAQADQGAEQNPEAKGEVPMH